MQQRWLVVMMSALAPVACLVGLATMLGAQKPVAQQSAKGITLAPCDVKGVAGKAQCGTFDVWENRDAKSGRRISLKVVVLPATGTDREPDALTYLAGGPGEAATTVAPFFATQFAAFHAKHDIVLVDQRGTGGSHALECDLYPGKDPHAALGSFFPLDRVRACRATLEKNADLRFYTTVASVDDLDDVRAALGYEQLDLFGGSYGTRAALVYMRRHSAHARAAVLQGVDPPSDLIPLHFPEDAQHAIDAVFADCAADAACHQAFPDLAADLRTIVARSQSAPVPAEILDPQTADPVRVSLSRDLVAEALRYLMYQSATALFVPDLVHQAAGGDFAPLAEFALFSRRTLVNGLGQGLYLSVTCSEDLPFINPADAERAAASAFLGDYRYRQQRAACDAWVRGPIPAGYHEPVRVGNPVLLMSGSWDPVTPPANANQVASTLPNSTNILVPSGGHDYEGLEGAETCTSAIANEFLERGSGKGVDTSCVERIRRPPFPTRPTQTKPAKLTEAQLAAFAGRYVANGAPDLEIRLSSGKLIGTVGGDTVALVAVGPTRLRLLGAIGSYLDADMENGRPARLTLDRTGVKTLTWIKK